MTPTSDPLSAFDDLLNLERSQSFHAGQHSVGLETMEALLRALKNGGMEGPAGRPPLCVHVAGSEGKTSVTVRIAAGLAAAGLRVGTYTSPHLRQPAERLCIDGMLPEPELLRSSVDTVCAAMASGGLKPSWFEALTATALVLFGRAGVGAAVWETGLGGRLDATRVLPADLCVLTTVSLEHTAVLGNTLAEIAQEKAGILRPGVPLVCGSWLPDEAREVVLAAAEKRSCPVRLVDPSPETERGLVDARNEALVAAVLEELSLGRGLEPASLKKACAAAFVQSIEGRDDLREGVLYDGAHTVAAAGALAKRLAERVPGPVILGVTSGRDGVAMAAALRPVAQPLVLTRAPGERGVDPEQMAEALKKKAEVKHGTSGGELFIEPDPHRALALGRRLAQARVPSPKESPENVRITVTGSLHLVGLLLPPSPSERLP
ncbi:MAG: hypothetical protein P8N09_02155 [Planctomycetota bacterium]|nr:hypothetical protein [Planctomycetota bacterium]